MGETRLTVRQFQERVNEFPWKGRITEVHWHHTYSPNHKDFKTQGGEKLVAGMRRYHVKVRGWRAPGQHVTIDPEGYIWLGRDWNWAPASARGHNGHDNSDRPFMFEMIGDFQKGHDSLTGAQLDAAASITAIILVKHNQHIDRDTIKFHKEMQATACPGDINKENIIEEVRSASKALLKIMHVPEESYSPELIVTPGYGLGHFFARLFGDKLWKKSN